MRVLLFFLLFASLISIIIVWAIPMIKRLFKEADTTYKKDEVIWMENEEKKDKKGEASKLV